MAAPPIPPIRLGLTGTGLAVEMLHRPGSRGLADRYEVAAFTGSSAEQSRRFAVPREGRFTGTPVRPPCTTSPRSGCSAATFVA